MLLLKEESRVSPSGFPLLGRSGSCLKSFHYRLCRLLPLPESDILEISCQRGGDLTPQALDDLATGPRISGSSLQIGARLDTLRSFTSSSRSDSVVSADFGVSKEAERDWAGVLGRLVPNSLECLRARGLAVETLSDWEGRREGRIKC